MTGVISPVGQPSSGGVSGPQGAYAGYLGKEQDVKNAGAAAASGVGTNSTMLTQQDAGANVLTAQTLMSQSDADAAAQAAAQVQGKQAAGTNLSNIGKGIGGILGGL